MAEQKPYVGDVGTELYFDLIDDISTAASFHVHVINPDCTVSEWVGTLDGTTRVKYEIVDGDWDQPGDFKYNPYIIYASGKRWHGNTYIQKVYALGE